MRRRLCLGALSCLVLAHPVHSAASTQPATLFARPQRGEPGCFEYPGLTDLAAREGAAQRWELPGDAGLYEGWANPLALVLTGSALANGSHPPLPPTWGCGVSSETSAAAVYQRTQEYPCIALGVQRAPPDPATAWTPAEIAPLPDSDPPAGASVLLTHGDSVTCGDERSVLVQYRCDPAAPLGNLTPVSVSGGCTVPGTPPGRYVVTFETPLACPRYTATACPPRTTPTPQRVGALKLLPAVPPGVGQQLFRNRSWPSWGGTVVRDLGTNHDQSYHLIASSFANGCGLSGWCCNGVAIHAVSNTGPGGPFAFSDVALPIYQHNAHAILHPDGTYLLFGIGQANDASIGVPCSGWLPTEPCKGRGPTTNVQLHTSRSPFGPWELVRDPLTGADHIITNHNANPSPYIFPNGSLLVLAFGMNVYYADHWAGPYRLIHQIPLDEMNTNRTDREAFCYNGAGCPNNQTCKLWIEDPFMLFDPSAQVWRALMHQYTSCISPTGDVMSGGSNMSLVGGYARSKTPSIFGEWEYDFARPAYSADVEFTDGTSVTLAGRERPKIYVDDQGKPVLLLNGVRFNPNPNESNTFTFAQPIAGWWD